MIIAMLLAHFVGDYVLQWDALAQWKAREVKGALVHSAIVFVITWLFALPFDPGFWPWVAFIGVTHALVDAAPVWVLQKLRRARTGLFELTRLLIDQTIHLAIIAIALIGGGYLRPATALADVLAAAQAAPWLTLTLAYVLVAMPAWILVEFAVYGLLNGTPPDFARIGPYKYVGTLERWLMTTFVLTGQLALVPLVAAPRLWLETRATPNANTPRPLVYVAEALASAMLAVAVGLAMRHILGQ